jgi:periplasmic copper chaperone A
MSTAVAGVNEVHEMRMDAGVMRMRAVDAIKLPAGQTVELKPGGYHLMLLDLKQPLALGDKVSVTLRFKDLQGNAFSQQLQVPVSRMPSSQDKAAHAHHH